MLISKSFWIGRHLPLLSPDNDGGGGPDGPSGATAATAATGASGSTGSTGATGDAEEFAGIAGLGDAGKEAIRRERAAAKVAADEAKKARDERDALLKEKNDLAAEDQKRKDKEAAESGKWEELATKREGELKSAKDEAASLQAQVDQFKAAMEQGLADAWAKLPEAVRKQGEELVAEGDILGRFTFMHKPSTQALVKELTDKAETLRGNGKNPKPTGDGKVTSEEASKSQAPLYRRF